jgi:hypothetical protein
MSMRSNEPLPREVNEKLAALQQRFNRLLAMLPTKPDPEWIHPSKLADVELIASEMVAVNADMRAVLAGMK